MVTAWQWPGDKCACLKARTRVGCNIDHLSITILFIEQNAAETGGPQLPTCRNLWALSCVWLIYMILRDFNFRSFLVDQDWSQRTKREGTFVLDSPEGPSTTPSSFRASTPLKKASVDPHSRSSSRSRIPSSKMLKSPIHESSYTNGNGTLAGDDLMAAISQVEETISPLARANSQIRDSLATLEKNLLLLKNASGHCGDINNFTNGE